MNQITANPALPLSGRRILVTRAIQQAGKLSDALAALGATPVEVPVLEIKPPQSFEPLDRALQHLDRFDWLILTSVNTVETIAARCRILNVDVSGIKLLKVAAIGSATSEAARKAGFRITVVPENSNSEGVVKALDASLAGQSVFLPRAKVARDLIPDSLTRAGANVTIAETHETLLPEGARELLASAIAERLDAATFTSSSSVRNLAEVAQEANLSFPLPGIAAISIGPVTSATLRQYGWEPAGEAETSDIPGLVQAVVAALP